MYKSGGKVLRNASVNNNNNYYYYIYMYINIIIIIIIIVVTIAIIPLIRSFINNNTIGENSKERALPSIC